jgi:hypothetical protein
MPRAGFEPAIPAGERLQTHGLDRSATGIGNQLILHMEIIAVLFYVHTKHINKQRGKNVDVLSVKPPGTYSNH